MCKEELLISFQSVGWVRAVIRIYRHTSLPHTVGACCYSNSAVSVGTHPLDVCTTKHRLQKHSSGHICLNRTRRNFCFMLYLKTPLKFEGVVHHQHTHMKGVESFYSSHGGLAVKCCDWQSWEKSGKQLKPTLPQHRHRNKQTRTWWDVMDRPNLFSLCRSEVGCKKRPYLRRVLKKEQRMSSHGYNAIESAL